MAKISEKSRIVLDFVKSIDGQANATAKDIAAETGLTPQSVNGCVTAFQKKGIMARVEAEIENEDGTHDKVKYIVLTDEGRAFDPDAQEDAE